MLIHVPFWFKMHVPLQLVGAPRLSRKEDSIMLKVT